MFPSQNLLLDGMQDLVMRWLKQHREHLSVNEAILLVLMEVS